MNFIKNSLRTLKRAVLGSVSADEEEYDEDGATRRRARRRAREHVMEQVPDDGVSRGGVQGFNWVKERELVDDDGDRADGFVVCDDGAGRASGGTKVGAIGGKANGGKGKKA